MLKPPKLVAVDVFFLRWLRDNGGKCDLPGDTDLGVYYRVVNSGYVEVGLDRFSDALRFTRRRRESRRAVRRTACAANPHIRPENELARELIPSRPETLSNAILLGRVVILLSSETDRPNHFFRGGRRANDDLDRRNDAFRYCFG
jgi:hypothetical protein